MTWRPNRATTTTIDDFNDQDFSEYNVDDATAFDFTTSSPAPQEGAAAMHILSGNSGSDTLQSGTGLNSYPRQGDKFRYYIQADGTNEGNWLFFWCAQSTDASSVLPDGYYIKNNYTNQTLTVGKRSGGANTKTTDDSNTVWPANQWNTVEVDHGASTAGDITATAYDGTGGSKSQIGTATISDTAFDTDGISFFGPSSSSDNSYWDYFHKF